MHANNIGKRVLRYEAEMGGNDSCNLSGFGRGHFCGGWVDVDAGDR
jgi:hypothetical protein